MIDHCTRTEELSISDSALAILVTSISSTSISSMPAVTFVNGAPFLFFAEKPDAAAARCRLAVISVNDNSTRFASPSFDCADVQRSISVVAIENGVRTVVPGYLVDVDLSADARFTMHPMPTDAGDVPVAFVQTDAVVGNRINRTNHAHHTQLLVSNAGMNDVVAAPPGPSATEPVVGAIAFPDVVLAVRRDGDLIAFPRGQRAVHLLHPTPWGTPRSALVDDEGGVWVSTDSELLFWPSVEQLGSTPARRSIAGKLVRAPLGNPNTVLIVAGTDAPAATRVYVATSNSAGLFDYTDGVCTNADGNDAPCPNDIMNVVGYVFDTATRDQLNQRLVINDGHLQFSGDRTSIGVDDGRTVVATYHGPGVADDDDAVVDDMANAYSCTRADAVICTHANIGVTDMPPPNATSLIRVGSDVFTLHVDVEPERVAGDLVSVFRNGRQEVRPGRLHDAIGLAANANCLTVAANGFSFTKNLFTDFAKINQADLPQHLLIPGTAEVEWLAFGPNSVGALTYAPNCSATVTGYGTNARPTFEIVGMWPRRDMNGDLVGVTLLEQVGIGVREWNYSPSDFGF
jgi:hypothetical protein